MRLYRLEQALSGYYKVKPLFTYVNEAGELVEFQREGFANFMRVNKYDYYIIWEVDELLVALFVPNTVYAEDLQCTIIYMRTDLIGPKQNTSNALTLEV